MKKILLLFFITGGLFFSNTSLAQKRQTAHPKPKVEVDTATPPPQDTASIKIDTTSSKIDTSFSAADTVIKTKKFMTGADQVKSYLTLLRSKKVAVVANQTSMVGTKHLVDTLLKLKVNIVCVFTPEHGFRGEGAAGEKVESYTDPETNIPVISLYGEHQAPTKKEMKDIDVVLYDIQDVGARFYTYISTMQNVMEACADNEKFMIVLDRPNPNGFYVDGPMLEGKQRSFVGMAPIPIVYGLTCGELANMLNLEGYIKHAPCRLRVIKMKNYSHRHLYNLPVKPSPNLQDQQAVYLYPSLCLFEGTAVSVGRGTDKPFHVAGFPGFKDATTTFKPQSNDAAPNPMYKDTLCSGWDLTHYVEDTTALPTKLNLSWLIKMYQAYPDKKKFFTPFFDKLAGTSRLREQIEKGMTEDQIRTTWQDDLKDYMLIRKKYLLYEEFGEGRRKGGKK
jgi:uncharacterized protein YbbC (DUF1343 family)